MLYRFCGMDADWKGLPKMEQYFLECEVEAGQFSGEYAVRAQMVGGQPFALFASEDDVECRVVPAAGEHVNALLKVEVLKVQGNLVLIMLPQPTLENGQTVTVAKSVLKKRAADRLQEA